MGEGLNTGKAPAGGAAPMGGPAPAGVPPKRGAATRKWLIGCSVAFVLFVVLCVIVSYAGLRKAQKALTETRATFASLGYKEVSGQQIDVREPVTTPTLFFAQTVTLASDVDTNIAIMAGSADIASHVKGDVFFLGQKITIAKSAVLDGNLDIRSAGVVYVEGTIAGKLRGSWRQLNNTGTIGAIEPGTVEPGPAQPPAVESTAAGAPEAVESTGAAGAAETVQSAPVQSTDAEGAVQSTDAQPTVQSTDAQATAQPAASQPAGQPAPAQSSGGG